MLYGRHGIEQPCVGIALEQVKSVRKKKDSKLTTKLGNALFIAPAQDWYGSRKSEGRELTMAERLRVAQRQQKGLVESLELAVGMNVMVTMNVETDLDVANGSRGEVVK